MGLSTDISKIKRPSLRGAKLPRPAEPETRRRPPTDEATAYSRLLEKYPDIGELVKRFDLVSPSTGDPVERVEQRPDKGEPVDGPRLKALAEELIEPGGSYTKEQIINRLQQAKKISRDRAERGFNLMLEAGAIEAIGKGLYYLGGSVPF